jgi:preprotein translocase subunit YajC
MSLSNLHPILAMGSPQSGTQQDPRAQTFTSFAMIAIMFVMLYFVLLRPQQKKAKQQEALLKAIRPGDKIITSSGIVGVVITVKEKTLSIRSADAKLEITKAAVADVTERSGEPSEAKSVSHESK